ncbi:MAG: biotin--[acetyl-CoA-carboxylase] ligase [Halieaceae bacterium]|jgi:BirA family biotin operon repressor/biotin-[acetyl-CoA-carboxylase] ligase|nr:biotin--[acetyl-CoA-carboxylase] ligase [Halieaceae bacterium]
MIGSDSLNPEHIQSGLTAEARALLGELRVHGAIDSTNAEALRRLESGAVPGLVITAEQQTAGRGRRGRDWVSPPAANIYLSVAWQFHGGVEAMDGLSLAVGVGVAEALAEQGLETVALKWPNDLLHGDAKLGGILVETSGHAAGPTSAVVGIGINLAMPDTEAEAIDQRWTDVSRAGGIRGGRNALLGSLLNHLLPLLANFESAGFHPWRERWLARNAHAGQSVALRSGDREIVGVVQGVDESGALLLDLGGTVQAFTGGELSLRPLA